MQWELVKRGRHCKFNIMVPPNATSLFSPPDAQVEEHQIITQEPEDANTSGMTTNLPDEQGEGKTRGILRKSNTQTGQRRIGESTCAACDAVSLRNNTARQSKSSEYLHWASSFAAAEDKSCDPPVKPKSKQFRRVAKRAHKVENR